MDELLEHSLRVALLSKQVAAYFALDENQMYIAGLLHDIGKTKVPKEILYKKDKLTELEFNKIKKHVEYGVELLQPYVSSDILEIIEQHHEDSSGPGYPKGIKIRNLESQILRACDIFDAVTSNRSYRQKINESEAIAILKNNNIAVEIIEAIKEVKQLRKQAQIRAW